MVTFEEIFCNLCDKIGKNFNWSAIAFTNKFFINEAKKEIKPGHSLYGKTMYSTAKCESNDDIIFVLEDNSYVILHLTFCDNIDVSYPKYISFPNVEDVMAYIEKQYYDGYC